MEQGVFEASTHRVDLLGVMKCNGCAWGRFRPKMHVRGGMIGARFADAWGADQRPQQLDLMPGWSDHQTAVLEIPKVELQKTQNRPEAHTRSIHSARSIAFTPLARLSSFHGSVGKSKRGVKLVLAAH